MDDLIAFLNARLDEDEAAAKATAPGGKRLRWMTDTTEADCGDCGRGRSVAYGVVSTGDVAGVAEALGLERGTAPAVAVHIARHDPARVLRDIAADRKLIAAYEGVAEYSDPWIGLSLAVRIRTERFSDHPDYRQEWKPIASPA